MKDTEKYVLVCGMAKSGIAAAELLHSLGAHVTLQDQKQREELPAEALALEQAGIALYTGKNPDEIACQQDFIVLSPGIPCDLPFIAAAEAAGVEVISEVELAYRYTPCPVTAITGTNGKTTTTTLTGEIMKAVRPHTAVVGNIGVPYSKKVMQLSEQDWVVAEISSFQLETADTFRPDVSGILNITEDHLNRHHTMEEYIRVKELIAANQTKEDYCILNYEDPVLREFAAGCGATVVFFSSVQRLEQGIFLEDGKILLRTKDQELEIVDTKDLKLLGQHNYENVMAASAMAYYAGVPVEIIRRAVTEFKAVAHRIEFVDEIQGVAYYNDSKGTNPDAAIKGIQAMNRPTLLIGGGYDKESSYEEWIEAFDGKVKYLVLIGQTREKIQETAHACGFMNTILADNLEEAVNICAQKAQKGDAVLLSPACASWGQFDNYEQRGDKFKEYVGRLKAYK